jgi:7,8-dihydropterin-6-yl-methyl-4-(beta-D-ribofuranosyl)aminobenzene 5'-phosphate synthase
MARTIHNLFCRARVIILVAEVLTGCLLTAGCANGHRQAEVATANQPAGPKAGSRAIQITVLYDNYTLSERCRTGWGFSCIITGTEKCILFDTGANADLLLENMDKLQVRAQDVNLVVISHDHPDHTVGLYSFLGRHSNALVYLPSTASAKLVQGVESRGAKIQMPDNALQICEGVHLTDSTFKGNVEQSLVLDTTEGLVVVTGCAHPGIVEIVKKAKQTLNKDVYLVLGGFHLLGLSDSQIQRIIQQLRDLGVRKVGPSHCTGERPIELFKQEYREDFVPIGVGRIGIPGKLWPATMH